MHWLRSGSARWMLLVGLGWTGLAGAVHPLVILEDSLEMRAETVRWPDSLRGVLVMTDCPGCKTDRFRIASNAQFLLRDEPVSFEESRAAAASRRYRKVFIAIWRETGEISSVRILP